MEFSDPMSRTALATAVLMLLSWLFVRLRGPRGGRAAASGRDALDTVADWPPQAARVMTVSEREAYELLRRALPGFVVLSQVPLSRFLRVPTRHSYTDWMQRVGGLCADLVLCDGSSRVLAVIDVRASHESERSRRRHERLGRVLTAAGIGVHVWREDQLPALGAVRSVFVGVMGDASPRDATPSRPVPLIPVAEIQEMLAEGDRAAFDQAHEPVPSAFFDELEAAASARR